MSKPDARRIVGQIRAELGALDAKVRRHPYVASVEAGQASRDSLKGFAGHQYYIIGSDLASVAQLISRHGAQAGREYLLGILTGESAAFDACLKFAGALGMDQAELAAYEPLPAGAAYAHFMAWLGSRGSACEFAAAILVNFAAWGSNCARMGLALRAKYGFKDEELAFFDLFVGSPPSFEQDSLEVIDHGLARGVEPSLVVRAARLLQGYELMYWDAMEGV
ncbi:MAG: hypothetical protein V1794_10600 [Candidatus Glassbacteria bacterium]